MSETCTLPKKTVLNNAGTASIVGGKLKEFRKCGCLRTSDKIKNILGTFPGPIPPNEMPDYMFDKASGYNYGQLNKSGMPPMMADCCRQAGIRPLPPAGAGKRIYSSSPESFHRGSHREITSGPPPSKSWQVVTELVALVQLSVTATALALYYLIYCYMHLVYFTLRSAMYFHNADGPMKITIGVVTVTTVIIGLHLLSRMQRMLSIFL